MKMEQEVLSKPLGTSKYKRRFKIFIDLQRFIKIQIYKHFLSTLYITLIWLNYLVKDFLTIYKFKFLNYIESKMNLEEIIDENLQNV